MGDKLQTELADAEALPRYMTPADAFLSLSSVLQSLFSLKHTDRKWDSTDFLRSAIDVDQSGTGFCAELRLAGVRYRLEVFPVLE